jgi:hypothetical protein
MGPCEIVWNYGESGAINLGPFLGATTFTGETAVENIEEERYGQAAVDAIMTGTAVSLELSMTRSTYEQLTEVLNAQYSSGDTLRLRNQLGCEMYEDAKQLVIKPICDGVVSTDPSEWVHIYHAYPVPKWELTWDRSTQRIFPITFMVFVSQVSGWLGDFGTLGMAAGSTKFGI